MPAPALTTIAALVPVTLPLALSVAINVWLPAVHNVAAKTPTPAVKVASADKMACPSLLLMWTVPV